MITHTHCAGGGCDFHVLGTLPAPTKFCGLPFSVLSCVPSLAEHFLSVCNAPGTGILYPGAGQLTSSGGPEGPAPTARPELTRSRRQGLCVTCRGIFSRCLILREIQVQSHGGNTEKREESGFLALSETVLTS